MVRDMTPPISAHTPSHDLPLSVDELAFIKKYPRHQKFLISTDRQQLFADISRLSNNPFAVAEAIYGSMPALEALDHLLALAELGHEKFKASFTLFLQGGSFAINKRIQDFEVEQLITDGDRQAIQKTFSQNSYLDDMQASWFYCTDDEKIEHMQKLAALLSENYQTDAPTIMINDAAPKNELGGHDSKYPLTLLLNKKNLPGKLPSLEVALKVFGPLLGVGIIAAAMKQFDAASTFLITAAALYKGEVHYPQTHIATTAHEYRHSLQSMAFDQKRPRTAAQKAIKLALLIEETYPLKNQEQYPEDRPIIEAAKKMYASNIMERDARNYQRLCIDIYQQRYPSPFLNLMSQPQSVFNKRFCALLLGTAVATTAVKALIENLR